MRKEILYQNISFSGVSARFKLMFSFLNAPVHFCISESVLMVKDSQLVCREMDNDTWSLEIEAELSSDTVCRFEATFEFDPIYSPIKYSWALPQIFNPNGVYVYSSMCVHVCLLQILNIFRN
jgi:hypothetical protein